MLEPIGPHLLHGLDYAGIVELRQELVRHLRQVQLMTGPFATAGAPGDSAWRRWCSRQICDLRRRHQVSKAEKLLKQIRDKYGDEREGWFKPRKTGAWEAKMRRMFPVKDEDYDRVVINPDPAVAVVRKREFGDALAALDLDWNTELTLHAAGNRLTLRREKNKYEAGNGVVREVKVADLEAAVHGVLTATLDLQPHKFKREEYENADCVALIDQGGHYSVRPVPREALS